MTKIIRKKLLASILSIAMLISFMPAMTFTVNAAELEPYTAKVNDSLPLLVSELSGLDNLSDIISMVGVQGYTQPSSGSNIARLYFVDPDLITGAGEVEYLDKIDDYPSDIVESEDETIYFKADTAGEYTFFIRIYDYVENDVIREITVTVTDGYTTMPTLTAGAVNRTSNTTATVNFNSDTEGSYYYKVVEDGDVEPTIDTGGVGTTCTTSETTITNPTGLTAGAMDIYIIVKDGAGNESTPLKIDIDAYISSDATLKTSSTVKGEAVTSLGTPSATLGSETAGAVTITAAKAADTSNATTFVTLFEKNDSNATVKAVKYASSSSTEGFETDAAYANEAIADGDFFIIKVIAEDAVKVNYYRINVEVTPVPSTTKAITAFNFNGLTPNVIGTVNEGAKTIALTVPYGTNVTSLVPIITHTGASLSPNTGVPQNFTSPVTYTVTAADSSTQQYTVTVSVAANPINAAKSLTADTTSNSVDNDLEITFTEDAAFRSGITAISYNGNTLTASQYDTTKSGKVILKPSVSGNTYLRTPGTANVVIKSTGYNDSTVSQTINAGVVTSLEVTTQPVPGTASGDAFGTQPVVKLKDQYGNYCMTGVSATTNVVATAKAVTGAWTIGGTTTKAASGGIATFTDLTCTLTTVGNGRITFTSGSVAVDSDEFNITQNVAKILTADTTGNSVDNDIEITFASDASFEGAITGVSFNGIALTVTTDYVVGSGKVTLKPSGGNAVLRTPGTANVVITASGYGDSTVSQTINAGQVAGIEVTKQPVTGAASGDAFATQPVVKLIDQYGNYCTTGVSATANVVATGKSGTGSWSIGGTTTRAATGGTATFTDLTCTLTAVGNGSITFTSGLVTVDSSEFNIPQNAAKTLTADTTNNSVDNDIEITFASDAGFQSAITSVTYGGNTLTSNQYTVTSGKVTLHPSINGNNYLRTPGTGNVVITATGYGDSTVSQTINHGVIATMAVTQNIIAPASNGGNFAQQPKVTLKDAYGNTCTSDNATIVTVAKEDAGTWTLTGTTTATAISGVATFTNLGATNSTIVSNAQLGFTSGIMTKVTSTAIALPAPASSGGSGGGGGSSTTAPAGNGTVNVIVNGKTESAGTETNSTENGKSTVTVAVNNKAIESKIEEAVKSNTTGQQNVIQVPVADKKADVVRVELTGDIVKQLETNTFDVSVKRDAVEYVIPAKELTISNVAKELGVAETSLKDIKVEVKITKLDDLVVAKYNEVAKENGATIVFPPTSFEVVAKTTNAAGKTEDVKINKFSNYVERVMEIPAGVDPSKVTTGVVFNADGTYSHVPTDVYQKDGKWYARLNSLTNSNYSVVWNPVTVKSVENHWAKDAVNDMASRLVIFNADTFEPNKAITRADFAEYIVRALGLYRQGEHQNKFTDINAKGNRTLAILIANEYGIVTGYSDGTFRGNNQITREEAMTMYQRAMKITKLTGSDTNRINTYTDSAQVSKWAVSYVTDVLSAHVFNGTTATTIAPKANLTYAEAAQAIKNLLVESKLINK